MTDQITQTVVHHELTQKNVIIIRGTLIPAIVPRTFGALEEGVVVEPEATPDMGLIHVCPDLVKGRSSPSSHQLFGVVDFNLSELRVRVRSTEASEASEESSSSGWEERERQAVMPMSTHSWILGILMAMSTHEFATHEFMSTHSREYS